MNPIIHRSVSTALEVRAAQRTIVGRAMPYNSPTEIYSQGSTFREVFRPGAFARSIAQRGDKVRLLANHDQRSFPIGKPDRLYELADGLYLEARMAPTRDGDEALALVADGYVTGLSVGFREVDAIWDREGTREVREAALHEISLVAFPAYEDAQVVGIRSREIELAQLAGDTTLAALAGRPLSLATRGLDLLEMET